MDQQFPSLSRSSAPVANVVSVGRNRPGNSEADLLLLATGLIVCLIEATDSYQRCRAAAARHGPASTFGNSLTLPHIRLEALRTTARSSMGLIESHIARIDSILASSHDVPFSSAD